ncbi:hypothetical protein HNY73_018080 [Argiope bruennichi]|uniref:Uncharacterized protein n=1 Tax=Argiope bruennichi TaxID=94029 RepID=A0A8T0ECL6_ARGBR|nr:hypothetical protein HNY73_018080 [Argiope bruennichi]
MSFPRTASCVLIALLSLVFIINVDGGHKKAPKTTSSPQNATRERKSYIAPDYRMDYYDYPEDLFLNETYNGTYGLGAYYNGYYGDYYGPYAYPELYEYYDAFDGNSTKIENPSITMDNEEKGTRKPQTRRSRRKSRSLAEESKMKHLCVMNLLNATNFFGKYIRHIFECKDKEIKHFACFDSEGFIKPCYLLKDKMEPEMPLCALNENASYVTTCNSTKPQSICFKDIKQMNRISVCNDTKRRVCFDGGLTLCSNQEKKREVRAIDVVNCHNCEVDVKMVVDETDNSPPKIQINVTSLDTLGKYANLMDTYEPEFDK